MAGCSFSTTAASVTYKQLAAAMLCCSSDIWAYCLCRSSSAGPVHSIAAINASTTTNSSMHKALYVQTQAGAHADTIVLQTTCHLHLWGSDTKLAA